MIKQFFVSLTFLLIFLFPLTSLAKEEKIDVIAKVILCENDKNFLDQLKILSVIHNRAALNDDISIEGYYRVISAKNQFSCYKVYHRKKFSKNSIKVLTHYINLMSNLVISPLINATHFYNKYLDNPIWKNKMKIVYVSPWHVFLAK